LKHPSFFFFQGSVGTPEVMQVDAGDFHATVEHNIGGQEIIHMSNQDSSTALPSALSKGGGEKSKTLGEEQWKQVRDLLLTTLTQGENKGETVVPASVLRLYHQLLNKQVPGGSEASSTQLQAAWLLAELVQLGAASKAGQGDKTMILGQEFGNKPGGQAGTKQNIPSQEGESEVLIEGVVKQIPVSRKLINSVKLESSDDIVVGTMEEEDCDSGNENTQKLRTTSDSENEDRQLGHGSDEL